MTPYIFCYLLLLISLSTGLLLDKLRIAAIIAFVPMFLLIALRGIVGTDSAVYIQSFDTIRYQGILASSFEPGFSILIEVLTWFFRDSFDILIVLGSVTAIIMLCAGLLLERAPLLFITVVMPYFLLDMSMNGLRYGLAFAIVALGAAGLARGWLKVFIICSIIAASIQVSSVLLAASLWALMEARIRTFLAVAFGLAVGLVLFGDHLEDRVTQNVDLSGLGGLSGIVPLLATAMIVAAVRYTDLHSSRRIFGSSAIIVAILVMQLMSFGVSRYYYAGLRLQSLFLFLLYLFVASMSQREVVDVSKNRLLTVAFTFTLILSTGSRLKNFNDDVGGYAPYNPYYFASELSG